MSIRDIILWGGGGGLVIILTLVQLAPIQINPWSSLAKAVGKAINADVLKEIEEVKTAQRQNQERLESHIKKDDNRNADRRRTRILHFNNEILREIPHTKEEFIEILTDIDAYEHYCDAHPDYKNSRAVHAIRNISRVYDERLEKHDFLQ